MLPPLGRYHPLAAKLAGFRSCSDCRPPLVHGRQQLVVRTGSLHMLGLQRPLPECDAHVPLSLLLRSGGR